MATPNPMLTESQVKRPELAITSDAWIQIGLYLKPRHLSKVMQTNKTIKKIVDNENYWARVAAQLVWRIGFDIEVPLPLFPEESGTLPKIDHNLYYMLGLDHGYYWAMERFIQRIDETIDQESMDDEEDESSDDEDYRGWWSSLKTMTLADKTHAYIEHTSRSYERMSMKELAESRYLESIVGDRNAKEYNRFLCEIEDDPMPPIYKKTLFRKLGKFLFNFNDGTRLSTDNLAFGICRF